MKKTPITQEKCILLESLHYEGDNELLARINTALLEYKEAYSQRRHSKKHLQEIIDACEEYIKQIPLERRKERNYLKENN
jgi:hypothetical protein